MMVGFLLARMGVDVWVLEKHADFLRDFRGDTIHPSTLELMYELGLLDDFLQRPHQKIEELAGQVGNEIVTIGDFRHLPTHCKFLAFMPQWDFLNFLVEKGKKYPTLHVAMRAEVTDLIEENGAVAGVRAKTPEGEREVRSKLVIGADGRHSLVRERAGLKVMNLGAPMDVLWLRVNKSPSDPSWTFGHIEAGRIFVMLDREEYWQCAFVIVKGGYERIRENGLPAFREEIVRMSPFLRDRVDELKDWNDISLLTVVVDRLEHWSRPGLLCIGDAAHAMSPIGGVGINLAIQDAVATANLLGAPLLRGPLAPGALDAVEERRRFPTEATQKMQLFIQNNVIGPVLARDRAVKLPWQMKLLGAVPWLRRIPARIIGMGFRPEHIRTPERHAG